MNLPVFELFMFGVIAYIVIEARAWLLKEHPSVARYIGFKADSVKKKVSETKKKTEGVVNNFNNKAKEVGK